MRDVIPGSEAFAAQDALPYGDLYAASPADPVVPGVVARSGI
jgi:hypothetical protein